VFRPEAVFWLDPGVRRPAPALGAGIETKHEPFETAKPSQQAHVSSQNSTLGHELLPRHSRFVGR
jgi:hypothetical protein